MRNFRRSIFKEARFVFEGENGGESWLDKMQAKAAAMSSSEAAPLIVPADAEKDAAAARKEGKAADVKNETAGEIAKKKTGIKLDQLKTSMGTQYQEMVGVLELKDKSFAGGVAKDLNFSGLPKENIAKKIESDLKKNKVDLKKFLDFVGGKEEDVAAAVAEIYASSITEKAESEFKAKYPKFEEFLKANPKYAGGSILFNVKFNQFTEAKEETVFTIDPADFDKTYQEFAAKTADAEKPKEKVDALREAKIAALEGSMLGWFLVTMGFVKKGEFDQVYSGQNGIANKIVSIFGGGALLKDGAAYEKMKKKAKPKIAGQLAKWEKAAQGSMLSLASVEVGEEDAAKAKEAAAKAPEYTSVGPKDLGKLFEGKTVRGIDESKMKVGIKLNSTFEMGRPKRPKSVKIDLSDGGKMILPKGKEYNNGKIVNSSKADEVLTFDLDDKSVEISGDIPAGTVFQGKIDFTVTT